MDTASACIAAKQCLIYQAAITDTATAKVVCFGSAAIDRYIDASMRFGETGTHQDIDLLFVPRAGHGEVGPLEAFVLSVVDRVNSTYPALSGQVSSSVNMTSNRLYSLIYLFEVDTLLT